MSETVLFQGTRNAKALRQCLDKKSNWKEKVPGLWAHPKQKVCWDQRCDLRQPFLPVSAVQVSHLYISQ